MADSVVNFIETHSSVPRKIPALALELDTARGNYIVTVDYDINILHSNYMEEAINIIRFEILDVSEPRALKIKICNSILVLRLRICLLDITSCGWKFIGLGLVTGSIINKKAWAYLGCKNLFSC